MASATYSAEILVLNKRQSIVHSHNGVCNMHDNREEYVAPQKWYDSKPQGTPILIFLYLNESKMIGRRIYEILNEDDEQRRA